MSSARQRRASDQDRAMNQKMPRQPTKSRTALKSLSSHGTSTSRASLATSQPENNVLDDLYLFSEPTGNFKKDFLHFCTKQEMDYIPPVLLRPRIRTSEDQVKQHILSAAQIIAETRKFQRPGFREKLGYAKPKISTINALYYDHSPVQKPGDKRDPDQSAKLGAGLKGTSKRTSDKKSYKSPREKSGSKDIRTYSSSGYKTYKDDELSMAGSTHDGGQEDLLRVLTDEDLQQQVENDQFSLNLEESEERTIYSSFLTTTSKAYFKPSIYVEQDDTKDDTTVTEVFIRGYEVDSQLMNMFLDLWPHLTQLHSVSLWNTALNNQTVEILAHITTLTAKLTTLVLDNNPLSLTPIDQFLSNSCSLTYLSFRFCGLTESDARSISKPLATVGCNIQTLLLTGNQIGDEGADALSKALRLNRSLLVLNLTSNLIGDKGAACLAVALSQFALSDSQVKERRSLLFNMLMGPGYYYARSSAQRSHAPASLLGKKGAANKTSAINTNTKKASKLKVSTDGGESTHDKGRTESLIKSINAPGKNQGKGKKKNQTFQSPRNIQKANVSFSSSILSGNLPEVDEHTLNNPLVDSGRSYQGKIIMTGNRTLISLNLSRNLIGKRGMKSLLEAVEFQMRPVEGSQQNMTGLKRLVVHHNAADTSEPAFEQLLHFMRRKDPMFKCPLVDLEKSYITPCSIPILA